MPAHLKFLQHVSYFHTEVPVDTGLVLFDIEMPKCGPNKICSIHMVEWIWDHRDGGIRWVGYLSKEPDDRFVFDNVHQSTNGDVFFQTVDWIIVSGGTGQSGYKGKDYTRYPYPIGYPFETLRGGARVSSPAFGIQFNVVIYYTVEDITQAQLTALTVRRGRTRHARPTGPGT